MLSLSSSNIPEAFANPSSLSPILRSDIQHHRILPKNHTYFKKSFSFREKLKQNKSESFEFKKDAQLFETGGTILIEEVFQSETRKVSLKWKLTHRFIQWKQITCKGKRESGSKCIRSYQKKVTFVELCFWRELAQFLKSNIDSKMGLQKSKVRQKKGWSTTPSE